MTLRLVRDDEPARNRIRASLDESLLVEAAAGTGKTTVLVERLVEVLATGRATIEQVVAVTFTRKAAGELKLRLRQELDQRHEAEPDAQRRERLAHAIARLEEALIGTIHSLCAELLRHRPVEARVDPAFRELDEEESAELYAAAFRRWIEGRLEEMPASLARALSRLAAQTSWAGSTPLERLRAAGRDLLEWRDYPADWEHRLFDRDAAVDAMLASVAEVAELYRGNEDSRDFLRQAIAPAEALDTWVRRSEEVSDGRDYDALEARLLETLRLLRRQARKTGRGRWPVDGISRAEVARQRDALVASLERFRCAADADLAVQLRAELQGVIAGYEELKRRNGQLDFLDLLLRARDLIRHDPQVRGYAQSNWTHLFIDEFQDTDPLQVELLLLLAAADPDTTDWRAARPVPGKLFLVGDPKQSIYRFRRADVVLYEDVKQILAAAGVATLDLTRSFRSVEPIQAMVNGAFAAEMTLDREGGQSEYVPLAPWREADDAQPAVVALPIPRPYGSYGVTKWSIEEGLPEVLAAWLDWLVRESGWLVEDPEDRRRRVPIRSCHIALLFRRFLSWGHDVTRPYLGALEARGLPHLLSGGRSFHQREEVETLRAALTAVEWPDDELSVFATLRGGLFAISDSALLRFREEVGRLHPFRPPLEGSDEVLRPVGEALQILAGLHRNRNRVPIAQTVVELLRATRAHAGFAMRPAGNQVLANVQRVCDLARAFELRGGLSFRGFVQRLGAAASGPGATETPVLEEGADGIRVMTVHGAKGLEFPVVVMADVTANLAHANPSTHVDREQRLCATRLLGCAPWELVENAPRELERDRNEGVRVAYVAATRARDLLVVPTVGDGPWDDGWVSPLNRALYPPREAFRRSAPAPGCPKFGDRSVLERPARGHGESDSSVKPGLHRSEAGTPVVWWDPAILNLEVPRNFGLRQEEILSPDAAEASRDGQADHRDWQEQRDHLLLRGSTPSCELVVISEAEEAPPGPARPVMVEEVARVREGPTGRRFGTLVHTVLRDVDMDATAAAIEGVARLQARALGATDEERHAACERVAATLSHPLLERARKAEEVHREAPLSLRLPDGRYVEGALDLAFRSGEEWTVVDFKTDARTDELVARYGNQAAWYAVAVEQLLGGRATAVLLAV